MTGNFLLPPSMIDQPNGRFSPISDRWPVKIFKWGFSFSDRLSNGLPLRLRFLQSFPRILFFLWPRGKTQQICSDVMEWRQRPRTISPVFPFSFYSLTSSWANGVMWKAPVRKTICEQITHRCKLTKAKKKEGCREFLDFRHPESGVEQLLRQFTILFGHYWRIITISV